MPVTTKKTSIYADVHLHSATLEKTVRKYVPSMSPNDDIFLKRLYAAFDVDNNKSIDFTYVYLFYS